MRNGCQPLSMTVSLQPSLSIRAGQLEDIGDIAKLLTVSFYPDDYFWGWFTPLFQLWDLSRSAIALSRSILAVHMVSEH